MAPDYDNFNDTVKDPRRHGNAEGFPLAHGMRHHFPLPSNSTQDALPLSWNEIKDRALAFSKEWANETSEDAEAKTFWDGFFNIFGATRRRLASFETPVKKSDGKGCLESSQSLHRIHLTVTPPSRGRLIIIEVHVFAEFKVPDSLFVVGLLRQLP